MYSYMYTKIPLSFFKASILSGPVRIAADALVKTLGCYLVMPYPPRRVGHVPDGDVLLL